METGAIDYEEIKKETGLNTGQVDRVLFFLDGLRESGKTNMFGAAPYVYDHFADLDKKQAEAITLFWMRTFGQRHSEDEG